MFLDRKGMVWFVVAELVLLAALFLTADSPSLTNTVGLLLLLGLCGFWYLALRRGQTSARFRGFRLPGPRVVQDLFGANQQGVSVLLAAGQLGAIALSWAGILAVSSVPFQPKVAEAAWLGALVAGVIVLIWACWALFGRRVAD